jgi:ribonuclease HI
LEVHHRYNWTKVNTDVASTKYPPNASGGGIFRDREGICIGCFAHDLGSVNAFHVELVAAMLALQIAHRRGITKLWFGTDSQLVALALSLML